jgi:hypothetical protein
MPPDADVYPGIKNGWILLKNKGNTNKVEQKGGMVNPR